VSTTGGSQGFQAVRGGRRTGGLSRFRQKEMFIPREGSEVTSERAGGRRRVSSDRVEGKHL